MNAIEVFRSNRAERLVDALNSRLSKPLADPFAPELVVVQGRGMAVWLSMQLAKRRGVWANAEFVYPKNFVRRAFAAVLPEAELEQDPFSRPRLLWNIMAILPKRIGEPVFAPIARYLADDKDGTRLFQLARRISESFDEYITYRPELLGRWEKSKSTDSENQLDLFAATTGSDYEGWQQALWTSLVTQNGCVHSAALERRFQQTLSRKRVPRGLPERISIFGLSSLPPQYVRVLAALSTQTQVQLFLLSPCKEYYAEAIPKHRDRKQSVFQNPLLLSYGALGAELQEIIATQLEARGVAEHAHDLYSEAEENHAPLSRASSADTEDAALSALAQMQQDILLHQDRSAQRTFPLAVSDESVSFHSCHSPIREVEVLHDQLLALLSGPNAVKPDEIVVMTPNIDDYAALIEAVFERSRDDARFIPYRISDRSLQADSTVLDAFVRILGLSDGRACASELLDVLALAPVRERFGISSGEVAQVADWVVKSGIRWGFDAQHRAAHDLPADPQNTWEFGLQRLLLGYAVASDEALCLGVLPFAEIEGKPALLLGRFAHFAETLFRHLRQLSQPRSPVQWQVLLTGLMADLLAEDQDNAWQHQQAHAALAEMVSDAAGTGFDAVLHLTVIRSLLRGQFDLNRDARGFLSGGITFCAMVPMRSIPFKIVCLLGMNDSSFPRRSQRADFNLLEHGGTPRQLGDPNRRTDDRYLFLEALLSARERLLLTFIGQSVRDNAIVPPSIVVTELLDYLVAHYGGSDPVAQAEVRKQLVTIHPLQPFSPRYFDSSNAKLFSFEQVFLQGAKLLGPERRPASPLFAAPLPRAELGEELALEELLGFFSGPASYLLRSRLKVQLEEDDLSIPDREPLQLSGLTGYQIGAPVLAQQLQGLTKEHCLELTLASGALPSGAPGVYEFQRILQNVEPIVEAVRLVRVGDALPACPFRLPLSPNLRLRGELSQIWPAGHVTVQYSRIRGKHLMRSWIQHLVLCALKPPGVTPYTWVIGRPETGDGRRICRYTPVASPVDLLRGLVALFESGQQLPLMWFPDSSLAFSKALRTPRGDLRSALYHSAEAWKTELGFSRVLQRLYGAGSELTATGPSTLDPAPSPTFEQVAAAVAAPMLDHLEDIA